MKKNIILFLSFLFNIVYISAQSDKKAGEILKTVSAKYKSYSSIKAVFTIEIEDQKKKTKEAQSGTLILKGEKYKYEIASQEVLCDGKTEWTYLKESNEVRVKEPTPDDSGISPANIFTMYEKGFAYKFDNEIKLEGKPVLVIELMPNNKKERYFKIKLYIDKSTSLIMQSVKFAKDGVRTTFVINNFTPNFKSSDEVFTFNKAAHPGIEVIDLR